MRLGTYNFSLRQIIIFAVLLVGLLITLYLVQHQQIFKGRATTDVYSAIHIDKPDNEPNSSITCSGNNCSTNTLNVKISIPDVSALVEP